ncbi:cytosol aminopeptidase-like, partial [Coregonus clupeaformis]|uniref:cytosol aminopeptidase-like n=1 Tax=Coregonus clupeaformis TaxID=59861 RepID=UPI001E1C308C
GLVLGVYETEKEEDSLHLTEAAAGVDRVLSGKLTELLKISGPGLKKGKNRIFYGLHEDFPCIAVVGLGRNSLGVCGTEYWDTCKENIRAAIAGGCRGLQDHALTHIEVDGCNDQLVCDRRLQGAPGPRVDPYRGGWV